jgi:renalase
MPGMSISSSKAPGLVASMASNVAVIGAGVAGAACAAALARAGHHVTVFDKARGPGGRMSTRRGQHVDAQPLAFDHGAQFFTARDAGFQAVVQQGLQAGWISPWAFAEAGLPPGEGHSAEPRYVAVPSMPELARRIIETASAEVAHPIQTAWPWQVAALQRDEHGWRLKRLEGQAQETKGAKEAKEAEPEFWADTFEHLVLAMPPEQAAVLLAPHRADWAEQAATAPMWPCWTLMALTEPVDWPFEAMRPASAQPGHPLGWLARNDHKPGRPVHPTLQAWVAQATPEWSAQHLELTPEQVTPLLHQALFTALGLREGQEAAVAHSAVHRWRYAQPARDASGGRVQAPWWDAALGLGVCGDFLGGGRVEAAWQSGHQLAQAMLLCTNPESRQA